MGRHKINIPKTRKRNFNVWAIILGFIALIAYVFALSYNFETKDIRENGELIRTPIVSIVSGGGKTIRYRANVFIENKELDAGSIDSKWQVGDTIAVRYIEGKSRVVQERVEVWRIYLWIGLWSISLLLGLASIIGGFFPQLDNVEKLRSPKKKKKRKRKK
ncbi:MAG: hypothetical protein LBR81_04180 [Prevotellaceae bacterium]|jgi:hypothetical protein|nr:hypothetical protein [Prevotellaceae bacterium]